MSDQKSISTQISVQHSPLQQKKQKIIISLEGNIGVGKSTFLKILKNHIDFEVINEPVDQWQNLKQGDKNLLELFYSEPTRYGYTFQSYALFSRVKHWQNIQKYEGKETVMISERSIMSDYNIFAMNSYDCGYMNQAEITIYKQWYDFLTTSFSNQINAIIYLRADPTVCMQRCHQRNRSEESNIQLQYLDMIHQKHEKWLNNRTSDSQTCPILILQLSKNIIEDMEFQKNIIFQVQNFINQIINQ